MPQTFDYMGALREGYTPKEIKRFVKGLDQQNDLEQRGAKFVQKQARQREAVNSMMENSRSRASAGLTPAETLYPAGVTRDPIGQDMQNMATAPRVPRPTGIVRAENVAPDLVSAFEQAPESSLGDATSGYLAEAPSVKLRGARGIVQGIKDAPKAGWLGLNQAASAGMQAIGDVMQEDIGILTKAAKATSDLLTLNMSPTEIPADTGSNVIQRVGRDAYAAHTQGMQELSDKYAPDSWGGAVMNAGAQAGQQLGILGAAAAIGIRNPAAMTNFSLGALGAQSGLTEYGDARSKGFDVPHSMLKGGVSGGMEVVTEVAPMGKLLNFMSTPAKKGVAAFLKDAAEYGLQDIGGELLNTMVTDVVNNKMQARPNMTPQEQADEVSRYFSSGEWKQAAATTFKQALLQGGIMLSAAKGAQHLDAKIRGEQSPLTDGVTFQPQNLPPVNPERQGRVDRLAGIMANESERTAQMRLNIANQRRNQQPVTALPAQSVEQVAPEAAQPAAPVESAQQPEITAQIVPTVAAPETPVATPEPATASAPEQDAESIAPELADLLRRKTNLEKAIFAADGTEKKTATKRMKDNYAALTATITALQQQNPEQEVNANGQQAEPETAAEPGAVAADAAGGAEGAAPADETGMGSAEAVPGGAASGVDEQSGDGVPLLQSPDVAEAPEASADIMALVDGKTDDQVQKTIDMVRGLNPERAGQIEAYWKSKATPVAESQAAQEPAPAAQDGRESVPPAGDATQKGEGVDLQSRETAEVTPIPAGRKEHIEKMIERHGGVNKIPPAWREQWDRINAQEAEQQDNTVTPSSSVPSANQKKPFDAAAFMAEREKEQARSDAAHERAYQLETPEVQDAQAKYENGTIDIDEFEKQLDQAQAGSTKEQATFQDMVREAARWKGAALNAEAVLGGDKKARLAHSRMTTKADLDAYLMRKFGVDDVTARSVSNDLTAKNVPADKSAQPAEFAGETWAHTPQPQQGKIGGKLAQGEVVLTATGRKTTPFPKVDTSTNGKSFNTFKRADQWLMNNAIEEARSRGDEFNLRQLEANRDKPTQADKDSAEMYLFGEEHLPVPKPFLKPLDQTSDTVTAGIEGAGLVREERAQKARAEKVGAWRAKYTEPAEVIASGDISRSDYEKLDELVQGGKISAKRAHQMVNDAVLSGVIDQKVGEYIKSKTPATSGPSATAEKKVAQDTTPGDLKGFDYKPGDGNDFSITKGNLTVKATHQGNGKYQASWGSATSSPHLDKQTVVDWAENIIKESQKAEKGKGQSKSATQPPPLSPVAAHDDFIKRLDEGSATPDELKTSFASLQENRDAIKAELGKLKKDDLLKRLGRMEAYRYKNDKKEIVVNAVFRRMLSSHNLSGTIQYNPMEKGAMDAALKAKVDATTERDIADHAEQVKAAREDAKKRVEGLVKSAKNPETWEEFQNFIRMHKDKGGIDALTPEQRKRYDELHAEHNKEAAAKQVERKATVREAGEHVDSEIIETTHTKTGDPLFVVKAADRVDKDVYKEWNATAKKLGGWYSSYRAGGAVPGFQFKTRESAESFKQYLKGDAGAATETIKERIEERQESKKQSAADKLVALAESMEEKANGVLNADRLTNTARRAQQAESTDAAARKQIALATTIRNIARAIQSGEAKHLEGISAATHVETLNSVLNRAKYTNLRENGGPSWSVTDERHRMPNESDMEFVSYPYPSADKAWLRDLANELRMRPGATRDGEWLLKASKLTGVRHEHLIEFRNNDAIDRLEKTLAKAKAVKRTKDLAENVAETMSDYKRLQKMGIPDVPTLRAALREYLQFKDEGPKADKAKQLERQLAGNKNVGIDFFPTPPAVAADLVERAGIEPGMKVLEPSGGTGNIAEAIRKAGADVDVAEISGQMRELLEAKGFNLVAHDFMGLDEGSYDAIVMNPPFSADIEHVRHAFDLLKPGGRLVSIVGEGSFGNQKKHTEFQDWLDEHGATVEKLPQGTFTDRTQLKTTGANARVVEMVRPKEVIARPLEDIKNDYAEVRVKWERDKTSPQHLSERMNELIKEAWSGYKVGEGDLIEYAHEYGAKSDDIPTLKKRISEVEKKLEKYRYHAISRAQATTREARASWLAEELGSLTKQLRAAERAQAVPEQTLIDTGLLRQHYSDSTLWQYRTAPEGTWFTANRKEDAVERAAGGYDKLPPEERLTREERNAKADLERYEALDSRYNKLTIPELEARLSGLDGEIASLQKTGAREFNGNGGRRTAAAVSNEGAREAGQEKMDLAFYLNERKAREGYRPAFSRLIPAGKRGNAQAYTVNLSPSQSLSMKEIRQEVSDGEAGGRAGIYNESAPGTTQVSWGSSFPEYFQNRGLTKKQVLPILDRIIRGESVTEAQWLIAEDMLKAKRYDTLNRILNERAEKQAESHVGMSREDLDAAKEDALDFFSQFGGEDEATEETTGSVRTDEREGAGKGDTSPVDTDRGPAPAADTIDESGWGQQVAAELSGSKKQVRFGDKAQTGRNVGLSEFMDEFTPDPQGGLSFSPGAQQDNRRATLSQKEIDKVVDLISRALPVDKVTLKIVDDITLPSDAKAAYAAHGVDKGAVAGMHQSVTNIRAGEVRSIITLAMDGATDRTGYHEVMHAAESLGVISVADLKALERVYPSKGGVDSSERRADAFAEYVANKEKSPGIASRVFGRIRAFLNRLGLALRGKGWRTADDVFSDLLGGKLRRDTSGVPRPDAGTQFMTAWHGSPHDHDKFSTDKIGTGEGAQAYGYGLYFAGNRAVAEYYRESLTDAKFDFDEFPADVLGYWNKYRSELMGLRVENGALVGSKKTVLRLKERAARAADKARVFEQYGDTEAQKAEGRKLRTEEDELLSLAEFVKSGAPLRLRPGRLYQVELAPQEDEYLLWDKPLSEQSDKVREALKKAENVRTEQVLAQREETRRSLTERGEDTTIIDGQIEILKEEIADPTLPGSTGEEYYRRMAGRGGLFNGQKEASEYLHSLGIRGIKYLDGSSRGKGDGNYNYVIFDDKDVSIEAKFSLNDSSTPTLDSMGLQQLYDRLASTKLVKDAMADLKRLGGHVYAQGNTAWKPWFQGMKDSLGKLFRRFRPTMEKLWQTVNNERGSLTLRTDRTGDPRVDAVLDKIGSPDKTLADRIKDSLGNLAHKETRMREIEQGFFDRYASMRYLDKMAGVTGPDDSSYIAARMTTSFSDVMYAMVHHGHPIWKDGGSAVSGKGLMEIFKPVADELDVFMGWMVGARAQKLMNEGRERYFDQDEINILKGLKTPENSARWEKVRRDYMQYKKQVLDFAEQAGVINPEARKIWDHEEYVPFYRVVEDKPKGPFKVKGLASQNSGIRTLKGADERLGDIFENIIQNFSHLADASIKNRATELAVQKAEQIGAATPAPLEWKAVKIGNQQVVDAVHEFFGETQDDIDAFVNPEEMEAFTTFFHPAKPMGKDVIHVLRDGKPQYYQVHDDLLLRSMTSINEQIWGGPAMAAMRFFKRLLTIGVTSDPTFMLRNFIRDTLHTWTISRGDFTPVISSLTGAIKAFREDDDMVQLMAAGGAFHGGFAYGNDPAAVKLMVRKLITKKGIDRNTILDTVKKVWEAYQEIGSALENAARVQTYANAKAKTGSHLQAAFDAKDIMDFSMRGDWSAINFLVQTVPFLGARIQGLQRLGKGAMENPVAFTLKGSAIALASTLLWLHNRLRPEYQELEEWDKDTYFHFFVGKKHFRLPKPFEVGAIFGTMPERLMELTLEKQHDGELFVDRMIAILTQTFAVGLPQILSEPGQQWANKDFFTGREIVGRDLQRLLPGEQSTPYTSVTAKGLGRAVNFSPKRIEHAVKGYFGTLGMYCLGASDILVRKLWDYPSEPATKPEDWPVLSAFYRGEGPARNTKYTTEFYELLREADQLTDTIQRLRETGEVPRADKLIEKNLPKLAVGGILGQVQSELSRINKQMKRVHLDRSMSPDEKKEQLVELQRIKNDITRGVVGQAKVERNQ